MANAGKQGNIGNTHPMGNPSRLSLAEAGQTYTILLGQNQAFEAGKILKGETVEVKASASHGFEYTGNTLIVDLPDSMFTTNAEGEDVALSTTSFLAGSLVHVTNASNPANNGLFALNSIAVSGADNHLVLSRSGFLSEAGNELRGGVTDQTVNTTGNITILPFSNAWCIHILGDVAQASTAAAANVTPVKWRMNNVAGTYANLTTVDLRPERYYGDTTLFQMENTINMYAFVYCQAPPSLEFSPSRRSILK